jgi:aminopeptidase N
MENATNVSMDESLFSDPRRARKTMAHELAHHWSGNLVRLGTWNDFWLNEGFADYLALSFLWATDGETVGRGWWRECLSLAHGSEGPKAFAVRPADPEMDVLNLWGSIAYKKGAWVLRMLEGQLGRERLMSFLHQWFDRHAFKHVVTEDLKRELSDFAGKDMSSFFDQWIYGTNFPVIQVSRAYDDAAKTVSLKVEQLQKLGPDAGFQFPLTIELSGGGAHERVNMEITGKTTELSAPLAFAPDGMIVDPDEVMYMQVACDEASTCREGYHCSNSGDQMACVP